jgi:hypothetical protein
MELFLLYIWLKLGSISTFLIFLTVVGLAVTLFMTIDIGLNREDYIKENRLKELTDFRKTAFIVVVTAGLGATFLPSKSDVAILVGASYAFKAADTPEAQKVMTLIRKKANEMLDEQLNEEKK